ncbi:MAG: penicillin acylase family protein [Phycisphaerales bacterium]|nr:penicillin acylase family protein [Phycisphaerales bacterium]
MMIGLLVLCAAAPVDVASLSAPVRIELDARSVPTITASDMLDATRGEGFIHARDRFFQMDMMRRFAAGEMAALAGRLVVDMDRQARVNRGRATCEAIYESLTSAEQSILLAYAEGVNAGLAAMEKNPPEYAMFGATMTAWTPVDSLLVNLSMTMTLTGSSDQELDAWPAHRYLSPEWLSFLLSPIDPRDRPMITGPDGAETLPPLPPAGTTIDPGEPPAGANPRRELPGSNNWAVAGSRTRDGGALMANDPHLLVTLPGIWYRIRMLWPDTDLMGLSLPGLPGVVIGTNGHVAWGFTNATIDRQDYVIVEVDPEDSSRYRVPGGWESFQDHEDVIEIAGGESEVFTSRWTRWGPVVKTDHEGRPIAVSWTALKPESVNINIVKMADARNVDDAVAVMRGWYGAPQNVVMADSSGRIAWVLSGWLPARRGFDGRSPVSWADGTRGWDGPLDESLRPVVIDPPDGVLYTANNRMVNAERARLLGHEWATPDRAERIGVLLGDRGELDESDMLEMQLDTAAPALELYRRMVLESVPEDHPDEMVRRAREWVATWNGRSDADQVGMGILDRYRRSTSRHVRRSLLTPLVEHGTAAAIMTPVPSGPIRFVLETQPEAHLPVGYDSWSDFNRRHFEDVVSEMVSSEDGLETPWGERNMSVVAHPLITALPPFLRDAMSIRQPQSGYWGSVRVASSRFGASARLVIDPAHPERAILQTPGGQSGHYDSPHWADFHDEWHRGEPTPLMPGATVKTIELVPGPAATTPSE